MYTCIYIYIYIDIHMYIYIHIYTNIYICPYSCGCIYTYMHIFIYIISCIHTYIQRCITHCISLHPYINNTITHCFSLHLTATHGTTACCFVLQCFVISPYHLLQTSLSKVNCEAPPCPPATIILLSKDTHPMSLRPGHGAAAVTYRGIESRIRVSHQNRKCERKKESVVRCQRAPHRLEQITSVHDESRSPGRQT